MTDMNIRNVDPDLVYKTRKKAMGERKTLRGVIIELMTGYIKTPAVLEEEHEKE